MKTKIIDIRIKILDHRSVILKLTYLTLILFLISGTVSGQSLKDYLTIASKNNPEIKATYSSFEAAMQKTPQVSALPDPILTMGAFGQMVETRVGPIEARFTLMQMFPWFGSLSAKENVANLMAEAAFQKYIDTKNMVLLEVKNLYAEMYEINQIIEIETENLQILDTYKTLALNKFSNGKGAMVDVVRIDIKRNESLTNIELLKEQIEPLNLQFNSLLNRNLNEIIETPTVLTFEENLIKPDSLFNENPKLLLLEKKKAAFEAQQLVSKKEGLPMIGIGLDYSIISKRDVPNLEMNGQDAIMPMLTVTLPIFRKKYNASVKEAQLMVKATDYEKQAIQNNLEASYSMANFKVQKAKKLKELYKKQVESTKQAIQLLLSAYSNSETNFEEILTMNQDLLMLETATVTANKNQFTAQSQLAYLLSKDE